MDISEFVGELEAGLGREIGEGKRQRQALRDYCRMERRSLRGLVQQYRLEQEAGRQTPTTRLSTLTGWSSRFCWQERAAVWDAAVERMLAERWARRQAEVNELDYQDGLKLREAAKTYVNELSMLKDAPTLSQVVSALEAGSKLQRLAAGQVTERRELGASEDLRRVLERIYGEEQEEVLGEQLSVTSEQDDEDDDDGDGSGDGGEGEQEAVLRKIYGA